MKKLMFLGLMLFITLVFTGCSNEVPSGDIETVSTNKGIDMKQAIETYGDEFQVIELSNTDFLIVWDSAQLIFNNNKCIGYVSLY